MTRILEDAAVLANLQKGLANLYKNKKLMALWVNFEKEQLTDPRLELFYQCELMKLMGTLLLAKLFVLPSRAGARHAPVQALVQAPTQAPVQAPVSYRIRSVNRAEQSRADITDNPLLPPSTTEFLELPDYWDTERHFVRTEVICNTKEKRGFSMKETAFHDERNGVFVGKKRRFVKGATYG